MGIGEDGGPATDVWTVAIDLRKVDALLTMLKQLDDQESAGYLMAAGNQVGVSCLFLVVFFFWGFISLNRTYLVTAGNQMGVFCLFFVFAVFFVLFSFVSFYFDLISWTRASWPPAGS